MYRSIWKIIADEIFSKEFKAFSNFFPKCIAFYLKPSFLSDIYENYVPLTIEILLVYHLFCEIVIFWIFYFKIKTKKKKKEKGLILYSSVTSMQYCWFTVRCLTWLQQDFPRKSGCKMFYSFYMIFFFESIELIEMHNKSFYT